jgi:cell division protein FtsN
VLPALPESEPGPAANAPPTSEGEGGTSATPPAPATASTAPTTESAKPAEAANTPAAAPKPPAQRRANQAPVNLLAAAPATEPAAPAPSGGAAGYRVQVSSQKSMEQAHASYAAMKRRYPSVLGSMQADIQQADLGSKGIFYRVRVGPWGTRDEAIEVCEALKAAGGSCFVTR